MEKYPEGKLNHFLEGHSISIDYTHTHTHAANHLANELFPFASLALTDQKNSSASHENWQRQSHICMSHTVNE